MGLKVLRWRLRNGRWKSRMVRGKELAKMLFRRLAVAQRRQRLRRLNCNDYTRYVVR